MKSLPPLWHSHRVTEGTSLQSFHMHVSSHKQDPRNTSLRTVCTEQCLVPDAGLCFTRPYWSNLHNLPSRYYHHSRSRRNRGTRAEELAQGTHTQQRAGPALAPRKLFQSQCSDPPKETYVGPVCCMVFVRDHFNGCTVVKSEQFLKAEIHLKTCIW